MNRAHSSPRGLGVKATCRSSKPKSGVRVPAPAPRSVRLLAKIALFQSAGDGSKPSRSTRLPLGRAARCRTLTPARLVRLQQGLPIRREFAGEQWMLITSNSRDRHPDPPPMCWCSSMAECPIVSRATLVRFQPPVPTPIVAECSVPRPRDGEMTGTARQDRAPTPSLLSERRCIGGRAMQLILCRQTETLPKA